MWLGGLNSGPRSVEPGSQSVGSTDTLSVGSSQHPFPTTVIGCGQSGPQSHVRCILLNKTDVHAFHAKPLSARKKAPDEVYFANGLRKAASNNQQRPSIIFPSTLSHKTAPPQGKLANRLYTGWGIVSPLTVATICISSRYYLGRSVAS